VKKNMIASQILTPYDVIKPYFFFTTSLWLLNVIERFVTKCQ